MTRALFLLVVLVVSALLALAKFVVGSVTGVDEWRETSVKKEAKVVMDKTAKAITWLEDQWEQAKREARDRDSRDSI